MAEMPNKLRRICKPQLRGTKLSLFSLVHANKIKTDGRPRKKIICAKLASKSAENFTLAPMSANIAQVTSIHRDCMQQKSSYSKWRQRDRKSTRLNSSHVASSYA